MSATLTHLSQQQHNACAKSLCSIIHLSVCRHCVQALFTPSSSLGRHSCFASLP